MILNVTQNISNPNPTGDYEYEDYTYIDVISYWPFAIFYLITFLLGTPGNLLVIWIAGFKMKTVNAVWILHLAIVDLICCTFVSFLSAFNFFDDSDELFYLYVTGHIAVLFSACASVIFLTAMSVDRCLSVMWPLWSKTHRTSKHVHITAAINWVISLFITGIRFFSFGMVFGSKPPLEYILIALLTFSFTVIITCYCKICLKLKKRNRPNRSQRSYRVITALIFGFFICWGPYYIHQIITDYLWWDINFTLYNVTFSLACFNSCINPIIYVFIDKNFKASLMESLPPGMKRVLNKCCNQTSRKPESDDEVISSMNV